MEGINCVSISIFQTNKSPGKEGDILRSWWGRALARPFTNLHTWAHKEIAIDIFCIMLMKSTDVDILYRFNWSYSYLSTLEQRIFNPVCLIMEGMLSQWCWVRSVSSHKSVRWSAVPAPCLSRQRFQLREGAGQWPQRGQWPTLSHIGEISPFPPSPTSPYL